MKREYLRKWTAIVFLFTGAAPLIPVNDVTSRLTATAQAQEEATFWLGADISGTTALEAYGITLKNAKGESRENTALMKELGLNAVRLRVWVNPKDSFCNKEDVLKMAKRAKALDMAVMIDFHYSDWWADPGKQNPPEAWKKYSYRKMKRALSRHTRQTLRLLKQEGIDVKWIQIGNETTHGMLWPIGKAETNMKQYAGLTRAGCRAAKRIFPQAQTIIHLDAGCDIARYHFIMDGLNLYHVNYDMIGLSVYPYWDVQAKLTSGDDETIIKVIGNMRDLWREYGKEMMIVETGYEVKYPEKGRDFLKRLILEAKHHTDGHCHGVFYWAPELEGHYPLGAFKNHQPTVIMDAFKAAEDSKANATDK